MLWLRRLTTTRELKDREHEKSIDNSAGGQVCGGVQVSDVRSGCCFEICWDAVWFEMGIDEGSARSNLPGILPVRGGALHSRSDARPGDGCEPGERLTSDAAFVVLLEFQCRGDSCLCDLFQQAVATISYPSSSALLPFRPTMSQHHTHRDLHS